MNEPWVARLREQFPITKHTAFFDIAYENCGADGNCYRRDFIGESENNAG